MPQRLDLIRQYHDDPRVSVLILGGGINGAGLLRELALQGVDCLLVDKADFAAGASSKSSRMIHGGLRYLEHREFALVRESLIERNRLLANAPHYVSPLKTTIPLFSRFGGTLRSAMIFCGLPARPGGRGALITRLGLSFYDWVTRNDRRTPTHCLQSRAQSLASLPALNPRIVATATYWDAQISQAERLCIELIQDAAAANPRSAALNYAMPRAAEHGTIQIDDLASGQTLRVQPRLVINATGAWLDKTNALLGLQTRFMGPTKGSHLVVDCPELHHALNGQMVYYQHTDGRVCIVFPFEDKIIMGSTDIPIADPDTARCDDDEIHYMLQTLRGVFPGIRLELRNIVHTFCGVRPLPNENKSITANITRGHRVEVLPPTENRPFSIHCLVGGKWTTFRALAEQAADGVLRELGLPRVCSTRHTPIGGGKDYPTDPPARQQWLHRVVAAAGIDDQRAAVLLDRYGAPAERFLHGVDDWDRLTTLPTYATWEIRRIAADEYVVHLSDIVFRRTTIGLLGGAREEILAEIARIAAPVLAWDPDRQQREVHQALLHPPTA